MPNGEEERLNYVRALAAWLEAMVSAGVMGEEEAKQVFSSAGEMIAEKGVTSDLPYHRPISEGHTFKEWQEIERQFAPLPAGLTAVDVAARYVAQNLRISPEDEKRLKKGLAMELESIKSQARATTEREYEPGELGRLKGIAEEAKRLGVGEEKAKAEYEAALAETERGKEIARTGGLPPSGREAEAGYWATPRPSAAGGFIVGEEREWEPPPEDYIPPTEVGAIGPQRWRDWFTHKYGGVVEKYMTKTPRERTEVGWSQYLEKERTRLYEEYHRRGAYARGERPSAFAPRVRTVRF